MCAIQRYITRNSRVWTSVGFHTMRRHNIVFPLQEEINTLGRVESMYLIYHPFLNPLNYCVLLSCVPSKGTNCSHQYDSHYSTSQYYVFPIQGKRSTLGRVDSIYLI